MLTELARQVGLALHNVELDSALQKSLEDLRLQAEELQESRARIVAASDAARRQIERNLHDGAQQHLVALAVNVRLARRLAETDPAGVPSRSSTSWARACKTPSRSSGPGPRHLPAACWPTEDRRGLAGGGRPGGPADEVEAGGLRRYSPELEAAVYFCCMEALQNAGKHAGPDAGATVKVWEDPGPLLRGGRRRGGFDARGARAKAPASST